MLERRRIDFAFKNSIGQHWIKENPFESHFLNTYTILITDGEKFIIRSCRKFLERIPEALRQEVKALFYQEGQHSIQHTKVLSVLEEQGYNLKWFIALTNAIAYKVYERVVPDVLLLSTCSGIEHLNATIAEFFLEDEELFDKASNEMAQIFAWHFSEEIEHGCVVYDVLSQVNSGYAVRLFGLIAAFLLFIPTLYLGAMFLAVQDRSVFRASFWSGLWKFTVSKGFGRGLLACIRQYVKRCFHPRDTLKPHLVEKGMAYHAMLVARSAR